MSTQQDIYAAGSESRPLMLNKENYVPWSSRLLRYTKSRPNGKLIHNSIINGPYVRRMIPEPGDINGDIPVNETFHVQTDDELTEKELKQIEVDDQAIQTILLGLLEDIYAAVNSCETAQEIWLRVQQMMKGSDIGIQEKKAKLFNEWERFTSNEGESIESYYHRFLKLMNDLKRNKHFPEKIASNLKFLNNLQPEWSPHKEVDELKSERLTKIQDPLALMANSKNPYAFPAPHQDQPSFNQNYMQQPMPNPEDITNPTTAMNMALSLIAKGFKLNYSTPTNNNQRISSNPRNRQIAQPSMNMGQDRQMQMVGGNGENQFRQYAGQNVGNLNGYNAVQNNGLIGVLGNANRNLNGNGNLVAARAEENAVGHNGNQIRCYNYRGVAEEFDLMAAATDLDEIEKVNANCILMANLQQASTSGTQSDKAPVYDSDGSAEVHDYENCDDNEIFNMFTQEEQYTELLEPIPEQHQVFDQKDNKRGTSRNTKFTKQSILGKPPMLDDIHALSKPDTSNSDPTPQESKIMKNNKVIAPEMFRINPFKTSREAKRVKKPKKVRFIERLATPKPSKPRSLLRWSPTGRMFDLNGKIIASSESKSQSDCSKGDNACTSNPVEPTIKRFPNATFYLAGTIRFGNDHVAAILGFGDLQWGNILITRVYFVEGLGHNLFSVGQFCDSNLEVAFRRNACFVRNLKGVDLLKRDRSTNLYTINLHEIASASPICLPKFKYNKEHLCLSYEQGKSKRASHPPKSIPNSRQRLHLLHMDLCGPMRIASINGKRYVLVIANDYSRYTWSHVIIIRTDNDTEFKNQVLKEYFDSVGISHQMSSVRTPQQNGVVERRNRTLVEAARTMLIFSCAPLFLWAEAIVTAYFNQNCSIIHRRFNKTPYELINSRKPDISFLHVFGALCYPKNDREDIGKLGAKATARTVTAAQEPQVRQTSTASTSIADTALTLTNSSSHATNIPNTSQDVDELNPNAMVDGNTFINPFANPSTSAAESSSSQNVDPSNIHTFYQPNPYEFKWTKDHPLEQVIGEPSRPVLTRNQLRS
nr:hypothetical protein [Tanacetum cinerariifolium]